MKFLMTDGKSSFPGGSNDTNVALYAFPCKLKLRFSAGEKPM
jgi:hypothetical protein